MTAVYDIRIIRRDGRGQIADDYHATVTRISDGKQLIFISRFKWWLKSVKLRPRMIKAEFKRSDKHDKKLAEIEEFTR